MTARRTPGEGAFLNLEEWLEMLGTDSRTGVADTEAPLKTKRKYEKNVKIETKHNRLC